MIKNYQITPQQSNCSILRFYKQLSPVLRQMLLLRALLNRALLLRLLLGGALVFTLNVRSGRADGPNFMPSNPLAKVGVGQFSSPAFADLDGDGDKDAFVGEIEGNILYFENVGNSGRPVFASPQTNPFGLPDVGIASNPTFVDIDNDGDLDAFIGIGFNVGNAGSTVYLENEGTATNPNFGSAQLNPFGLTDVGDAARPSFADINHDGDFDAFIGNFDGDIVYFPNTGTPTNPTFGAPSTNPFGLTNEGDGFRTPTFVDINGDGDLDAFIGQFGGEINYYRNTGTPTNPTFAAPLTYPFGLVKVGIYSVPTFADIDGDGDLDAFIGEQSGVTNYFENKGTAVVPSFSLFPANPFDLTDVGNASGPTFADLDGDGDADALVGENEGNILYFRNIGSAANPHFTTPITNPFGLADVNSNTTPVLVDIDDDNDLDIFIGGKIGIIFYRENTGTPTNPAFGPQLTNPFGLASVGDYSSPTFVDIDNDHDFDTFVGNKDGDIVYFQNTGTVSVPQFTTPITNPFGLASVMGYSAPVFVDIDGDKDFDIFVGVGGIGGLTGPGADAGNVIYFENIGNVTTPAFGGRQTNPFGLADIGSRNNPTFVDIDGDGGIEAFIGENDGQVFYFDSSSVNIYLPIVVK